jgi:hypothetical protein
MPRQNLIVASYNILLGILKYHVVAGTHYSADLKDGQKITTVEGKDLTVHTRGGRVLFCFIRISLYCILFMTQTNIVMGDGGEGVGWVGV